MRRYKMPTLVTVQAVFLFLLLAGLLASCRIPFLPDRYEATSPEDTFTNEYDPIESFLVAVEIGEEELVMRGLHPDSPRRERTLSEIQADFPMDRVYKVHDGVVWRYTDLEAYYDDASPEEVFYFDVKTETYGDWTSFKVDRVYDWSTEGP